MDIFSVATQLCLMKFLAFNLEYSMKKGCYLKREL